MLRIVLSLIFFVGIPLHLGALIVTSPSIQTVYDHCQKEDCMLFTDLDETIGLRIYDPKLKKCLLKKVLFKPFKLHFFDRLLFVQKLVPMEPVTIPLLKKLQDQKHPVVIITARPHQVAEQTEKHLKGLDFDAGINNPIDQMHYALDRKIQFKNGVIYCANKNKGPILIAFLRQNNLSPKEIIYVDNKLKHVKSVHDALHAAGINCTAIHYTRDNALPYLSSFKEIF